MEIQGDIRPWYKKKRCIAAIGVATLVILVGAGSSSPTIQPSTQVAAPAVSNQTYVQVDSLRTSYTQKLQENQPTSNYSGLSNNNYYINTSGNKVHSPAYSNSIPAGASAQCRDGTYSFSQSRRGTCSHHGGVATWL